MANVPFRTAGSDQARHHGVVLDPVSLGCGVGATLPILPRPGSRQFPEERAGEWREASRTSAASGSPPPDAPPSPRQPGAEALVLGETVPLVRPSPLPAAGKQSRFPSLSCPPLPSVQFMECLMIGRDLVRLLQNVARIPEFELLWKDIIHNPQALSPQFTGK